jgi:hypothetical protein
MRSLAHAAVLVMSTAAKRSGETLDVNTGTQRPTAYRCLRLSIRDISSFQGPSGKVGMTMVPIWSSQSEMNV